MLRTIAVVLTLLSAPVLGQLTTARPAAAKRPGVSLPAPNIVVIIADDFGVDFISAYDEGSSPPCTPNLDGLAATGLLFRNAWANPACTPTRAALLTGRHGFRTGLGIPGAGGTLAVSETIIPEVLSTAGYASTAVGKWHLGNGAMHPNASGFDRFAGSLAGQVSSYTEWTKTVDGSSGPTTTYATTDTTDEAIAALGTLTEPFFLYVSYNAPHTPVHIPADSLCPGSGCENHVSWCDTVSPGPGSTPAERTKAMAEAMDTEIGRLLGALDSVDPSAYVLFLGDNGTAAQASESPFESNHAKGTMYEGGINVPFIVRGPGVAVAESPALVSVVDLHATLAELAGVPSLAEDSISLVPLFSNPRLGLREFVYSERFSPNGPGPWTDHRRAVRNDRYKLIRRLGQADELYDLVVTPFETTDLLPDLTPAQQAAYDVLVAELTRLGVD